MAKQYVNLNTPRNEKRCNAVVPIVDELRPYWPLTLRQVHYQLFSRQAEWFNASYKGTPGELFYQNTLNQYKGLSCLLTEMRAEGRVPWEAIEDPTRRVSDKRGVEDVSMTVDQAAAWLDSQRYERCLMQEQENYIEVWTEKLTLWNILERVTNSYCLRLVNAKGWSSSTQTYEYGQRARQALKKGQQPIILFISDFDPSGMGMLGAIQNKIESELRLEGIKYCRPALTPEQINQYQLPRNPEALKTGDSRAKEFIRKYGRKSVELDGLHPSDLQDLVRESIEQYVDIELMEVQKGLEEKERERLDAFWQDFEKLREEHGL